jgi:hypothetical protein
VSSPFVPKHGPRPRGPQVCAYAPDGDTAGDCGKPATWHVMWDDTLDNSMTCGEHMALILRRWVFLDRHPVHADCNMPGALWLFKGNRCEMPGSDDGTVEHAAASRTA